MQALCVEDSDVEEPGQQRSAAPVISDVDAVKNAVPQVRDADLRAQLPAELSPDDINFAQSKAWSYSAPLIHAMHAYFSSIRWQPAGQGTTMLELFADFVFSTNVLPVYKVPGGRANVADLLQFFRAAMRVLAARWGLTSLFPEGAEQTRLNHLNVLNVAKQQHAINMRVSFQSYDKVVEFFTDVLRNTTAKQNLQFPFPLQLGSFPPEWEARFDTTGNAIRARRGHALCLRTHRADLARSELLRAHNEDADAGQVRRHTVELVPPDDTTMLHLTPSQIWPYMAKVRCVICSKQSAIQQLRKFIAVPCTGSLL
jgi:hypothetical protein